MRQRDLAGQETIAQYLLLHESEWGGKITRYALDALADKKTSTLLPVTDDLKVRSYFHFPKHHSYHQKFVVTILHV